MTAFDLFSLPKKNDPIVSREENKSKYVAYNNERLHFREIRADMDLPGHGREKRCDYVFLVNCDFGLQMVLLELKGTDIIHALEQIKETYSYMKNQLDADADCFCRIVVRKVCSISLMTKNYKVFERFARKNNIGIRIKSIEIKEDWPIR